MRQYSAKLVASSQPLGLNHQARETLLGPPSPMLTVVDFSVLMIAIHSALYIFKPSTSIGEGGLYPYRYIVYVLWIILPLLLASLAFLNPNGAYESGGASCHLPVRPFWYRLALSWIPRYCIFIFILATDASIYLYVRYKFGNSGQSNNSSTQPSRYRDSGERRQGQNWTGTSNRRYGLPPTPPLAYHRVIPETSISWTGPNVPALDEPPKSPAQTMSSSSFMKWAKRTFPGQHRKNATYYNIPTLVPQRSDAVNTIDAPAMETTVTTSTPAAITPVPGTLSSGQTSRTSFAARFNSRSPSKGPVLSFLCPIQRDSSFSRNALVPLPQLELFDSEGHNLNQISIMQTRSKIRQQLRFLFVYPLAYIAMWALPFVSNALQYNDYYAANPPFVLSVFVTVITVSQSAVDCWIFNIKERPWRQSLENKGWVVQGLACLKDWRSWRRRSSQLWGGVGKSKGIMEEEARFAYQRRDEERAARASEISSAGRSERRERSWWDEIEPTAGAMSPLAESSMTALVDGQAAATDDAGSRPQEALGENYGCAIT